MEKKNEILSFPLNKDSCSKNEMDIIPNVSRVFYFTVPTSCLCPAAHRLSQGDSSQIYFNTMSILTTLTCSMLDFMKMRTENMRIDGVSHEVKRVGVYFEYIIPSTVVEINKANLMASLGIRFIFVVNDNEYNLHDYLKLYFVQSKKKSPDNQGNIPSETYDFHLATGDIHTWYNILKLYTRSNESIDAQLHTTGSDNIPLLSHPLHPENAFCFENSLLSNMSYCQRQDICAYPKLVFELHQKRFYDPIVLLVFTLPGTKHWDERFQDYVLELYAKILAPRKQLCEYYSRAYVKKNDLKDIRDRFESRISKNETLEDVRKDTLRGLSNVWAATANVSNPIKIMATWQKNYDTWTNGKMYNYSDDLSFFGNMIANEFINYELDLNLSTTHSALFELLINSMDAYRYKLDLHANCMMLGQGATGKSHLLNTISDTLIQGTITKVTHNTSKAATVDTDRNDHITLLHEAPPELMGKSATGDQKTGDHILKDMLTSCVVETTSIVVDQGRRYTYTASSESVGVLLIATNESEDTIPEALSSRTIKIPIHNKDRPGFSTTEIQSNIGTHSEKRDSYYLKEFQEKWKMRQLMVNMVEKAIYCQVLPEPDISVMKAMLSKIIIFWKNNGIINEGEDSTRKVKFIHTFTRSLVILHAVEKFANDPTSPGYKKEISFENLYDIRKYLFCNEEIACFACSLLSPRLVNGGATHLLQCFFHSYKTRFVRDTETCDPTVDCDGNYTILTTHSSRAQFFSSLILAQGASGLRVKLSPENLKVAFNYMSRTSYKGRSIAYYDDSRAILHLNKDYINNFFEYDKKQKNFVVKNDYNDVATFGYDRAYSHKYMKENRTFITGTQQHEFTPFILNIFKPKRSDRLFKAHQTNHDFLKKDSKATINFSHDFEDASYNEFCSKLGLETFNIDDLYSMPKNENIIKQSDKYPEDIVRLYNESHNISPKGEPEM